LFCEEVWREYMAVGELTRRVEELLEPEADANGFELVAVEQSGGRHVPVIRVLLDREGGVTIDDLASANEWVSAVLDDSDVVPGSYTLEVSSPGVDRPLRKLADFERFEGETATVKTRAGQTGRSTWTGRIERVEGDSVVLDIDGEPVAIAFNDILKARLKGVVDFGKGGTT
jgi:ribosome maturation factor RimP